jgi:S1-C subfamily serine protease
MAAEPRREASAVHASSQIPNRANSQSWSEAARLRAKKAIAPSSLRPGGAGDRAGLKRGDILVRLGRHPIDTVQDFSFVLNASKPGETVTAVVMRDGKELRVQVTWDCNA